MSRIYVGLDCEMSGTDVLEHKLIQIGISFDARSQSKNFVSDVGWEKGTYRYDPESLQVIEWDFSRIEAGPPAYKVETKILEFFEENDVGPGSAIPVGWAVGRFDMPFVKATFPNIWHYFVWPKANQNNVVALDLTYVAMTFGFNNTKKELGYNGWKKASKRYAQTELEKIGVSAQWHDAGYDARAAILCLEYFRSQIETRKGTSTKP